MPWREVVSPYRTLVSELMLQQTRVDTVIPYFERFMATFPTVEALAAAPLERVLERWSGLGYYSRARNLHAAARVVRDAGGFPSDLEGLRALPGVGPYTAGAVGSIALGLDLPVVDGNVARVLCRQFAWAEDPQRVSRRLWEAAESLLPRGDAGDFNQALMELGATICTPTSPKCLLCPVRGSCAGVGDPLSYPRKAPRPLVPEVEAVAAVISREGTILLARRPETGLLAGLWEPPGGEGTDLGAILGARLGVDLVEAAPVGEVVHVFSHRRVTTQVFLATIRGEPAPTDYQDARWVPRADIDAMALSTLARKLLAYDSAPAIRSRTQSTHAPRAGRSRLSKVTSTRGGDSSNRG